MTDPHLQREWERLDAGYKQWAASGLDLPGGKTKTVYISGGMSGLPANNFPAFNEAADRLRAEGWEVVNPADKGIVDGWEWEDYLRYDIKQICDCDAVYMLDGWPSSRGARLELKVAEALGLEVLYE